MIVVKKASLKWSCTHALTCSNSQSGNSLPSLGEWQYWKLQHRGRATVPSDDCLLLPQLLAAAQVCMGTVPRHLGGVLVGAEIRTGFCLQEPSHTHNKKKNRKTSPTLEYNIEISIFKSSECHCTSQICVCEYWVSCHYHYLVLN